MCALDQLPRELAEQVLTPDDLNDLLYQRLQERAEPETAGGRRMPEARSRTCREATGEVPADPLSERH